MKKDQTLGVLELGLLLEKQVKAGRRLSKQAWSHELRRLADSLEAKRSQRAPRAEPSPRRLFVPDQLIVSVREDALVSRTDKATASTTVGLVESLSRPFARFEQEGLIEEVIAISTDVSTMADDSAVERLTRSVVRARDAGTQSINLVRLAPHASLTEIRAALEDEAAVEYVERVPLRKAPRPRPRAASAAPWNLALLGSTAPVSAAIKVAVLDTGIDVDHPALPAVTYHHDDTSAEDIVGHGTHVAGILAGKSGQRAGWHGIASPDLHVWKIFGDTPDEDGDYYVDELLYQRALRAARRDGCKVVNLSIGGYRASTEERRLIKDLVSAGVAVVAAMGNEYLEGNPTEYPAALEGVIAVGAIDEHKARASFSNTGSHIALVAPGTSILSTLPRKTSAARDETGWGEWDGTSMATPHVSGAAAILLAKTPTANARERLMQDAVKLTAMGPRSWTRTLGAGLLHL